MIGDALFLARALSGKPQRNKQALKEAGMHRVRSYRPDALSAIELLALEIDLAELLTRRRCIIGTGALALGSVTGCGPDEQAAAPTATSAPATRSFTHARGTTALPVQPQRVIAHGDLLETSDELRRIWHGQAN
jgi:hypothetical protein